MDAVQAYNALSMPFCQRSPSVFFVRRISFPTCMCNVQALSIISRQTALSIIVSVSQNLLGALSRLRLEDLSANSDLYHTCRSLQGAPYSAVFHDRLKLSSGGRRMKIEQKFQLLEPGVPPVKHFSIWQRVE